MKPLSLFILCSIVFNIACKADKKTPINNEVKEQTVLEKIAFSNGFAYWKNVKKINFTFNVDRDTTHYERSWIWNVSENTVTNITTKDTISYSRKKLDSITSKVNGGFINDKFWLLAPFNLMWDADNITYTISKKQTAPIDKKEYNKLTIVYGNEGGYTPGDAYDFYYDASFKIKEWVFRKANQEEASMTTTWEDYSVIKGIHIAKMHKKDEGSFSLYFTNVSIE